MHHILTVLDHALTGFIAATPLDPVTMAVATNHIQDVIQESRLRIGDDHDPMVNMAVLVRCMLLLTQLQGLLDERDDYPLLILDVESQVAAEQIYQRACL